MSEQVDSLLIRADAETIDRILSMLITAEEYGEIEHYSALRKEGE